VSPRLKDLVLELLNTHRIMSISTNRLDGWPQTTVVGYVNDGFFLYCFVARDSQKYANALRDPRVSIANWERRYGSARHQGPVARRKGERGH
jgi:nitroimidazol reductase NimA-like FMN-containing flavoprotein (pyridoxamine 5'-phosphate oxidase superfamily)